VSTIREISLTLIEIGALRTVPTKATTSAVPPLFAVSTPRLTLAIVGGVTRNFGFTPAIGAPAASRAAACSTIVSPASSFSFGAESVTLATGIRGRAVITAGCAKALPLAISSPSRTAPFHASLVGCTMRYILLKEGAHRSQLTARRLCREP